MYNEHIYHLDLCILAYHLHSQTLIWPMDPYYEQMARIGTDRRTDFMKRVRSEGNSILNESGGNINNENFVFPVHLDPILYDYSRINPHRPSFVRPLKKWIVYNTPSQITGRIRNTYMKRTGQDLVPTNQSSPDDATDDLYCFEGETGGIVDESMIELKAGAKSMMGFVLARQISDNPQEYDVHIVFRGSRSGSAARAFLKGKFREKGNPDWVTDMDYGVFVQDSHINRFGKCCRGFRTSVNSMLPNILRCLVAIYSSNNNKPPRKIYVTGHSLGGALACHFTSAMVLGTKYGPDGLGGATPNEVAMFPWHSVKLYTYGAPVVGDKAFAQSFSGKINHIRVFIDGDKVVTEGKAVKALTNLLGKNIKLKHANAVVFKLKNEANEKGDPHEPFKIRRQLIRDLGNNNQDLSNVPASGKNDLVSKLEPWKVYNTFDQVLIHPAFYLTANEPNLMLPKFARHLRRYLQSIKVMFSPKNDDIISKLIERVLDLQTNYQQDTWTNFPDWWKSIKIQFNDDSTHKFLALCFLLGVFSNNPHADSTGYYEWIQEV